MPRRRGPFLPGQGLIPPYLAGREEEQDRIQHLFDWLEDGLAPGCDLILCGPRGNGKTALMAWAVREARPRGIGTLKFMAADIRSEERLFRRLSVVPSWLKLLSAVNIAGVGVKTRDSPVGSIGDALAGRVRMRALVLAVDEAHTLAVEVGQLLLQAVQDLRSDQVPVMLLLAGTPDLPRHLNSMESSFWGRSEILPLGLLNPEDAADAIRIPIEAEGRSISEEALAQVVAESHGYPYFVQVWGKLLWKEMLDSTGPASLHEVARARPRFEKARNTYYQDRHGELKRAKLAFVAAKVASAFLDNERLTDREVDEASDWRWSRRGVRPAKML